MIHRLMRRALPWAFGFWAAVGAAWAVFELLT